MRTTLDLPSRLLNEAKRRIGVKTKTEAIIQALEEAIRFHKLDTLRTLRGKLRLTYHAALRHDPDRV